MSLNFALGRCKERSFRPLLTSLGGALEPCKGRSVAGLFMKFPYVARRTVELALPQPSPYTARGAP